jgi:hypothetical protein
MRINHKKNLAYALVVLTVGVFLKQYPHTVNFWASPELETFLVSGDVGSLATDAAGSSREDRFPSVEDRVKLYMSDWYVPPCAGYIDGMIRYEYVNEIASQWQKVKLLRYTNHPLASNLSVLEIDNIIRADTPFLMSSDIIRHCAHKNVNESDDKELELASRFLGKLFRYCIDIKQSFVPVWNRVQSENEEKESPPALLQFGDHRATVNFPLFTKVRYSFKDASELERVTAKQCYSTPRDMMKTTHMTNNFQSILWMMTRQRHYGMLDQVSMSDTDWDKKKDCAIFKGALTGQEDRFSRKHSDEEKCLQIPRCRLVYSYSNSSLIKASLSTTRGRLPDVLNGVPLVGPMLSMADMLQCKGLISIQGNDVATGLKWALLSMSVVLMSPPTITSWAMEELLLPWVVCFTNFHDSCLLGELHSDPL